MTRTNDVILSNMQGFQLLLDQQSGFGRVAADLLLALQDDYGHTPSILFGLQSASAPSRDGQVYP